MGRSPAHAVRITFHYQHGQKFARPTHYLFDNSLAREQRIKTASINNLP